LHTRNQGIPRGTSHRAWGCLRTEPDTRPWLSWLQLPERCQGAQSKAAGHTGRDCQAKECLELEEGKGLPSEAHTAAKRASSMSSDGLAGGYHKDGAGNSHNSSNPPTPPPSVATLSARASGPGKGGPVGLPHSPASLAHSAAGSRASSREVRPAGTAAPCWPCCLHPTTCRAPGHYSWLVLSAKPG